ncbi:hypothetical protein EDB85DRAFT_1952106 [Lactarius pseudohatsudake]|nr:hypothetical protein EDB85DRAFT_1952106 [Lactarius pseudohatsudake]
MLPSSPATVKEILKIARRTTDIIRDHITPNVCLFGSAASYLWANIGRDPNDIDIVLWDEYGFSDPEDVKQIIVAVDDRYYLEPSKKLGATHEILYCRLPGWRTNGRCVKVDILAPGTLGLPEIDWDDQVWISNVPVMPLFALLVMKTKGWWDHRISSRLDFRAKEGADLTDIDALLDRALEQKVSYQVEKDRYTSEFTRRGITLARKFVRIYGQPEKWRRLGFPL